MTGALRGFESLRIHPAEPFGPYQGRTCTFVREDGQPCGARLAWDNQDEVCTCHTQKGYDPPSWAVALAEVADGTTLEAVAYELRCQIEGVESRYTTKRKTDTQRRYRAKLRGSIR